MTDRAIVAVIRRMDAAIVAEAQDAGVVTVRRSRPIVAVVADTDETATAVAATTRSRIPDGRSTAELAGEVHAFVGTVVGSYVIR